MADETTSNGKMDIGLLILGVTGAFGIWSSLQTSPTGLFKFVAKDKDEQTERVARDAMNLALTLILLMAVGLVLVYKRSGVAAAIGTAVSGVGLYIYYNWLLKQGEKIRNGESCRYSMNSNNNSVPTVDNSQVIEQKSETK